MPLTQPRISFTMKNGPPFFIVMENHGHDDPRGGGGQSGTGTWCAARISEEWGLGTDHCLRKGVL